MIIKKESGVPTIPASADHRNGDWIATDIYEGELYMDTDTGAVYTRNAGQISLSGEAVLYAQVDISAAELKDLLANPVLLVPNPGAGKYIKKISRALEFTYNTVQYTGPGGTYLVDSDEDYWTDLKANTGDRVTTDFYVEDNSVKVNQALTLTQFATSDYSAGDGEVRIKLWYTIESL
jgi:hypothetical protein